MTNILTWNINKLKSILFHKVLKEIIYEKGIEILVLQESYGKSVNTLLNLEFDEIPYPGNGYGSGVRIFLKKSVFKYYTVRRTDNRKLVFVSLKRINGKEEFNIAAVHLHSKVGNTERQQLWKNLPVIEKLKEFENTSANTKNTILIGDFNHNPYESNLTDPYMINCIENRDIINMLIKNRFSRNCSDYWYNPMLNLLGDFDYKTKNCRVTGTYYRYKDDETRIWNLLDGIILRPSLMNRIDNNQTEIIFKTKTENLLKPFTIRTDESLIKDDLPDHLPIKFTINIY